MYGIIKPSIKSLDLFHAAFILKISLFIFLLKSLSQKFRHIIKHEQTLGELISASQLFLLSDMRTFIQFSLVI